MAIQDIQITRQFPIIDEFVQIQPNSPKDRYKYSLDTITDLFNCVSINKISSQRWLELNEYNPDELPSLCEAVTETSLSDNFVNDLDIYQPINIAQTPATPANSALPGIWTQYDSNFSGYTIAQEGTLATADWQDGVETASNVQFSAALGGVIHKQIQVGPALLQPLTQLPFDITTHPAIIVLYMQAANIQSLSGADTEMSRIFYGDPQSKFAGDASYVRLDRFETGLERLLTLDNSGGVGTDFSTISFNTQGQCAMAMRFAANAAIKGELYTPNGSLTAPDFVTGDGPDTHFNYGFWMPAGEWFGGDAHKIAFTGWRVYT